MSVPDSLCIDLGASFTKIAYRSGADAPSHLLTHADLPDEHHFCIPTVAARNRANGAWVFGHHAAGLKSGPRVDVFQNWKADLFGPDADPDVDLRMLDGAPPEAKALLLEGVPALRAFDVATRFLGWLWDTQLPEMLGHDRFRAAEAQLCVPEFVLESPLAPRLERVMGEIGFRNAGSITLSEPKANLVGVLTEGRNPRTAGGTPNLGAMFGDADVARRLAQPDQAVLIVDVGAYTTDFALANFAHHDEDGFDDDPSHSVRLGVRRLDDWILANAAADAREEIEASPMAREQFHTTVHGGVAVAHPETYGLSAASVEAAVERFANEVLDVVDTFLRDAEPTGLHAAVLTGGGSNIRGIANRLAAGFAQRGVSTLHAPRSTDAPAEVLRYGLGPELVRGASAIGGCSILYRG